MIAFKKSNCQLPSPTCWINPQYKHGALRRIYYRQSDLDAFKGIRKIDSDEEKR